MEARIQSDPPAEIVSITIAPAARTPRTATRTGAGGDTAAKKPSSSGTLKAPASGRSFRPRKAARGPADPRRGSPALPGPGPRPAAADPRARARRAGPA